jgi:hypothetical protein
VGSGFDTVHTKVVVDSSALRQLWCVVSCCKLTKVNLILWCRCEAEGTLASRTQFQRQGGLDSNRHESCSVVVILRGS